MSVELHIGTPTSARRFHDVLTAAAGRTSHVDTAPYYCDGDALAVLGDDRKLAQSFQITTRVPCLADPGVAGEAECYPPGWIARSTRAQLAACRLDQFHSVLLERWHSGWDAARVTDELAKIAADGLCVSVGVALPDTEPLAALALAGKPDQTIVQGDASLLNRSFLDVISRYAERGHALQVRAPLFHGLLGPQLDLPRVTREPTPRGGLFSRLGDHAPRLRERYLAAARELGTEIHILAIAYVMRRLANGGIVLGCSSADQVHANVAAWERARQLSGRLAVGSVPGDRIL